MRDIKMIEVSKLYFHKLVLNGRLIDYFGGADVPAASAETRHSTNYFPVLNVNKSKSRHFLCSHFNPLSFMLIKESSLFLGKIFRLDRFLFSSKR